MNFIQNKIAERLGGINFGKETKLYKFARIKKAGIVALQNLSITDDNCSRYERRHELLLTVLKEVGFECDKPKATFYNYVRAPKGTKRGVVFNNAEDASEYLIKEALVSTVPWDDAGAYLRFSVTFEANGIEEEKVIINEMAERFKRLELVF